MYFCSTRFHYKKFRQLDTSSILMLETMEEYYVTIFAYCNFFSPPMRHRFCEQYFWNSDLSMFDISLWLQVILIHSFTLIAFIFLETSPSFHNCKFSSWLFTEEEIICSTLSISPCKQLFWDFMTWVLTVISLLSTHSSLFTFQLGFAYSSLDYPRTIRIIYFRLNPP